MSIALIDSDIVAFRSAASCKEGDGLDICLLRIDNLMNQILGACGTDRYRSFLSGSRNWRKDLYPAYKANRTKEDPPFRQAAKEYLITHWNSEVSDGLEADDEIGIAKTEHGDEAIICSIDKDFKQFGGKFYDFVKDEHYQVTKLQALHYFYEQMLLGDRSDNVPGFDGMARQKPTNYLKNICQQLRYLSEEEDMYNLVYEVFVDKDQFELTGQLLYIWRKNPDKWIPAFKQGAAAQFESTKQTPEEHTPS